MTVGDDQYSGDTYQVGIDYQFNEPLKLFAEYYAEEKNYAILQKDTRSASDYLGAGGFSAEQNGKAFVVGMRYDF